ncbi:uncharacterized protein L3040_000521 [Drepanopeziza brunnea f. sp. 'multigermtubi']|uniref:uncharacterized protein n=1 Tax=Drepanopeziza brunnea f. sp. 'multigermtubi' TaxID=698441 RepID=UPI00239D71B3|nr:hypothetical protein L3040_000521 [Drepanopeziza brunnea f. sp. 'multigermtubi']
MYDSTSNFTLDTICPWTYLVKNRLDEAFRRVRETDASSKVNFTIVYRPYQLYPKPAKKEKIATASIDYKFNGTVANTLNAHRVIQYSQAKSGPAVVDRLTSSLYRQYFEEEKHPSSKETLMTACQKAGIEEKEAADVIGDASEGLVETKTAIREQASNGVDSVPYVAIEGRRRDLTIQGASEVHDYFKALNQIFKESV